MHDLSEEQQQEEDIRMNEYNRWLNIQVLVAFIPFCFANFVFIVPFYIPDEREEFKIIFTGICYFIMFMTYIILFFMFSFLQFKVWSNLKNKNFFDGRISNRSILAFFTVTNTYLFVKIWIMYTFSSPFFKYIFDNKDATTLSNPYTEFFHSYMSLEQIQEMDSSFKMIMLLLHFNPIDLILKYMIIKLEDLPDIISSVKEYGKTLNQVP